MKEHSLLVKFITCFLLFLIVPLILASSIFYYYTMRYSENEISESNIGKLKIIRNMNEMMLEQLRTDALTISINSRVKDINQINSYQTIFNNSENIVKMGKAIDEINKLVSTSNLIQSIYLYPEKYDYVITNSEVQLKKEFTDNSWVENFNQYTQGKRKDLWTTPRNLRYGGYNEYVISLIYPLNGYTTNLRGALVINIKEDKFCNLINSNNFESEGGISILNGEGRILSSINENNSAAYSSQNPYVKDILKSEKGEGNLRVKIKDKPYLVTYYKSEFNNWIYISTFPMDKLMSKVTALRVKIIYCFLLVCIIGFIVSVIISRKLYSPVNKLVQDIKRHRDLIEKDNNDEMGILSSAFETLINNEESMKKYIVKNRQSVRERYIVNLLNGITKNYDNTILNISGNRFICAALSISKYVDFLSMYPMDKRLYIKNLILNICEEVFKSSYECYGVVLENEKLALLISFKDKPIEKQSEDQCIEDLFEKFEVIREQISTVIDNDIIVGLGNFHMELQGINHSYKEAMNCLKRKLIYYGRKIIVWNDKYDREKDYFYPYNEEKHIFSLLTLGIKKDVNCSVNSFFEKIRINSEDGISIDNVIQIISQLSSNTIKYFVENNIKLCDVFNENINIYGCVQDKDTLEEIEEWFIEFYEKIIDYNCNMLKQNKIYIEKIMGYIKINYRKDMSIENVADYVGLSYSYVRKIFKVETGKNIVDYTNFIRITEAKIILNETDTSVIDIALTLGYNNQQSFCRFFKKYEGITPGEFRNRNTSLYT